MEHGPGVARRHEAQFRRASIPINTPITTAPAITPMGLRRAMFSSSDPKVFACLEAAEAISAPLSARSLATPPTWPATLDVTSRADFAASLPAWDMNFVSVSLRLLRSARSECKSDPAEFIGSLATVPIASLPRATDSEIDEPDP